MHIYIYKYIYYESEKMLYIDIFMYISVKKYVVSYVTKQGHLPDMYIFYT